MGVRPLSTRRPPDLSLSIRCLDAALIEPCLVSRRDGHVTLGALLTRKPFLTRVLCSQRPDGLSVFCQACSGLREGSPEGPPALSHLLQALVYASFSRGLSRILEAPLPGLTVNLQPRFSSSP